MSFANVNPNVDHPRWTQSSEKRIGAGLFAGRTKTQMFNDYCEQGQCKDLVFAATNNHDAKLKEHTCRYLIH